MQEGSSIRSSNFNARPLALRRIKGSIQEEVCSLLTKHIKGVRNTLRPENAEIFSKYKFYAIPRHGRDVPGFLIIQKEGTYFYNPRREETYLLKMRLSTEIRENTVLIGTLYYFSKKLVLEDVYSWKGELVWETHTFEKRWELLREFFEKHWTQDLYIQKNLEIEPAKIMSLEESLLSLDPEMGVDYQPNDPKRKRFFWFQGNVKRPLTKDDLALAPSFKPEPRKPTKLASLTSLISNKKGKVEEELEKEESSEEEEIEKVKENVFITPDKKLTKATFKPHIEFPDVYELFDQKKSLGFASVQEYAISQKLSSAKPGSLVKIRWNSEFSKYQIVDLY